jgi:hypothetical protein
MAKEKKYRLTYAEHSEAAIHAAVKEAIPIGGIFADFLTDICLQLIPQRGNEFERGIVEGTRRFAGQLLDMARSEIKESGK